MGIERSGVKRLVKMGRSDGNVLCGLQRKRMRHNITSYLKSQPAHLILGIPSDENFRDFVAKKVGNGFIKILI